MKRVNSVLRISLAVNFLFLAHHQFQARRLGESRLQPGGRTRAIDLPRTVAIASNLAGTGAHALASGLSAVASRVNADRAKVQPYNGPNAWMPLLENGEVEFGIINILDSYMAVTGTGNYKKAYPMLRVVSGGVFPVHRQHHGARQIGHQTAQRSERQADGVGLRRPRDHTDLAKRRHGSGRPQAERRGAGALSNCNDAIRAVPEGKVDATFAAIGIGINEEANAMEPIRFLSLPNTATLPTRFCQIRRIDRESRSPPPASAVTPTSSAIRCILLARPKSAIAPCRPCSKPGGIILPSCRPSIHSLRNGPRTFRRSPTSPFRIIRERLSFTEKLACGRAKHDARTKEICG